ncbi:hypothetical protein BVRB_3g051340 [Beta vulgaris subsp. vulgaris]|nr:hypothetical protein BVRB_3g051340 [Beta vulgaris subsp. vulgaris]
MAEAIGIELGKLVVEKLGFKAGKLIMSAKDINSQIERLQETKSIIEATLRDADPLESCSSVEGKMIRNLHGIEARLEYFFDEKQTRAKQKELMGGSRHSKELRLFFSSLNQLVSPFRTAAKIKEIKEELESIARDHSLELRTLEWFVVGEDTSESSRSKGSAAGGLTELSDLNNLKGLLRIIVDRESKYIAAEAKTAHLKMKNQLTVLIIDFKKSGKKDYMVLEALQPHGANLKYLEISNYGGEKLPDWICTLNSLEYLSIYGCQQLDKLSDSIGSLTSLKTLEICGCPRLESLPHQISNLSQLDKIYIIRCSKVLVERCRNPTESTLRAIPGKKFLGTGANGSKVLVSRVLTTCDNT